LTLDTAILLDDSYAAFYNNRGLNYYKLDNDPSAISDFKKAIRLDSSNWVFFANVVLAYKSDGKQEEACRALQIAKRIGLDLIKYDQDDLEKLVDSCE
jgi:tetratricopeptide (TPR) repeat protein